MNESLLDFEKMQKLERFVVIGNQRPEVDKLNENLVKFDIAFERMCENSKEYKGEFQMTFKQVDFPHNFKELVNHHVQV